MIFFIIFEDVRASVLTEVVILLFINSFRINPFYTSTLLKLLCFVFEYVGRLNPQMSLWNCCRTGYNVCVFRKGE